MFSVLLHKKDNTVTTFRHLKPWYLKAPSEIKEYSFDLFDIFIYI